MTVSFIFSEENQSLYDPRLELWRSQGFLQKTYNGELKCEAVRLAHTSEKPSTHVARDLGISDTSIHHWRKEIGLLYVFCFPGEVWIVTAHLRHTRFQVVFQPEAFLGLTGEAPGSSSKGG